MDYCGPRGIAHSTFLSWSEEDQDKAITWMIESAKQCNQCGTYRDIWVDAEGRWVDPSPYEAVVEVCGGCDAIHEAQKEIPEDMRHRYHVHLQRREPN